MSRNSVKLDKLLENTDVFEGMVSIRSVFDGIDAGLSKRKIISVLFCEDNVKGNGKLLGFLKARSFVYHSPAPVPARAGSWNRARNLRRGGR